MLAVVMLLAAGAGEGPAGDPWSDAARHATANRECLARAQGVAEAWWDRRDRETDLLPEAVDSPLWTPENAAADLWPFLWLTARFTDAALERDLLGTYRADLAHATRVGALTDAWSLAERRWVRAEVDIPRLIFGSTEFCKDGLMPLLERTGRGPWGERMLAIVIDVFAHAPIDSAFGRLPADDAEVNGGLLQVLSRLYCATGDGRLLEWAERIADAYCSEVMRDAPLPAYRWDFKAHAPLIDELSLDDHGNEILGGLAEVYLAVAREHPAKARAWEPVLCRMFDTLLDRARNPDGLWYSRLTASTAQVTARETPDTWGYAFCAVDTFGLATGQPRYRRAVEQALAGIDRAAYHDWSSADDYADSIEGGLLLYNRLGAPEGEAWLDVVEPKLLARQREDGLVEGWHADGNYCRTALMLAFWHSRGVYVEPWRDDVRLGAVEHEGRLYVWLQADADWSGRLHFDTARHREILNLPLDYPRLNQFPEWFTVDRTRLYAVTDDGAESLVSGEDLVQGLPLTVPGGEARRLGVAPAPGPPYGGGVLERDLTGVVDLAGQQYRGETYAWAGSGPILLELPARRGQPHELRLRWGSKLDVRRGRVVIGGRVIPVEHGNYDGYEWVTIEIPAELVTAETLAVRIEAADAKAPAPFVSEVQLFAGAGGE